MKTIPNLLTKIMNLTIKSLMESTFNKYLIPTESS